MFTECIMRIPGSVHEASLQDSSPLHILIIILERDIMSFRQNNQGWPGSHGILRGNFGSFQEDHDVSRSQWNNPHRRSMAIHDMLNSSDEDSSTPSRHQSLRVGSEEDRQMSRFPNINDSSERSSSTLSNHGRRRMPSTSSRSSVTRAPRQFRPPYSEEEIHFIWYHRIDLGYEWSDIARAYNAQFPQRQREGFGGIQCKYYRLREAYNIPRVRLRNRSSFSENAYGMQSTTGLSYPWMHR